MQAVFSLFALYARAILIAILLALFFRTFVVQIFWVPSHSMSEILLPGDHILVNKFIYGEPPSFPLGLPVREVRRGEVVVFRFPVEPTLVLVKRCLAGPHDQVEIRSGSLRVNQEWIDESGYASLSEEEPPLGPFRLPDQSFFCLGDHRAASYDSRAWGLVPRDLVLGKALIVLWSSEWNPDAAREGGFWDRIRAIFSSFSAFLSNVRPVRALRVIR